MKLRDSCGPNDPLKNCEFLRESHLNLIQELPSEYENGANYTPGQDKSTKKEAEHYKLPSQFTSGPQSSYLFDQKPMDFLNNFSQQQSNFMGNQLQDDHFFIQNSLQTCGYIDHRG